MTLPYMLTTKYRRGKFVGAELDGTKLTETNLAALGIKRLEIRQYYQSRNVSILVAAVALTHAIN